MKNFKEEGLSMSKGNLEIYKGFALLSQLGFTLSVPIILCAMLGNYIDEKMNTKVFIIVFILIGIYAGCYSSYTLLKKIMNQKKDDE